MALRNARAANRRAQGAGVALGAVFCLALAGASPARAAIAFADLGKNLEFRQTDAAGTTAPIGPANAFFFARVFYSSGEYNGGSLSFNSTTLPFNGQSHDCCGSTGGQYQTGYLTKAAMDAAFPAGGTTYTLEVTDSSNTNPTRDIHIAQPDDLYTGTANPTFSAASFNSLNSLTPGQGLTILTSTFSPDPNATSGQTFLSIYDFTANAGIYSAFGSNTRSSWMVDPGLFQAGHQYEAQLIFDNLVGSSDDGVPTTARSDLRTDVLFQLKAGAPEPAAWALMLVGFGGIGAILRRNRRAAVTA